MSVLEDELLGETIKTAPMKQVKGMQYEITEKREGELPIHIVSSRSFNELELLAEDLECVKMWLDAKNAPTHDKHNKQYSVIGRIEFLLRMSAKQLNEVR